MSGYELAILLASESTLGLGIWFPADAASKLPGISLFRGSGGDAMGGLGILASARGGG